PFFFQAEDGIRAFHVTGVQTCALPIYWPIIAQPAMPPTRPATMFATPCPAHSRFLLLGVSVMSSTMVAVINDSSNPTTASGIARSEERRVGEECESRRWLSRGWKRECT